MEKLQIQLDALKIEMEDLKYLLHKKIGGGTSDIKGTIGSPSTIPATTIPAGTITKTQISYETADITISAGNTSGTASVTSGSIPVGYFLTAFTTPVSSYVQLVVAGTILTTTLSSAPGAGNSITIRTFLLKA